MKLSKTERFTDDCKSCGWCPEKESSTIPLGDCGLCFNCMDKFVATAVDNKDFHGCLTGDCPHEDVNNCVYAMAEAMSEQAAILDARGGRIQRQNQMLAAKDARIAELEAAVVQVKERHLDPLANQEGQDLLRMDLNNLDDLIQSTQPRKETP